MMMRRVFTTTALLLGLSVAAHADTLAAGLLYANPSQIGANCYLFNAGPGSVAVTSKQIIAADGVPIPLNFQNTCNVLAAGRSCGIGGTIANKGYSCRFVISPSAANVRGDFQILAPSGSSGTVLTREALR